MESGSPLRHEFLDPFFDAMPFEDEYLEVNRANWDARVPIHLTAYELEQFRRDSDYLSRVVRFDLARLPDVNGLRGIHLQCHIGTDTVSLARLGARMTGLDFSPAAIAAARNLSEELGAGISYVESEFYQALVNLEKVGVQQGFDFAYTGIGALCWLPDIRGWAQTISELLKPGGFLFVRDGHPMLWSLDDSQPDGSLKVGHDYFGGRGIYFEEEFTYAGEGRVSSPGSFSFNHSLSEIFNALWASGMRIDTFEEHDSVPWNPLGEEFELDDTAGEWRLKDNPARLAASYTIVAWRES